MEIRDPKSTADDVTAYPKLRFAAGLEHPRWPNGSRFSVGHSTQLLRLSFAMQPKLTPSTRAVGFSRETSPSQGGGNGKFPL